MQRFSTGCILVADQPVTILSQQNLSLSVSQQTDRTGQARVTLARACSDLSPAESLEFSSRLSVDK